jgi:hypothetical protein
MESPHINSHKEKHMQVPSNRREYPRQRWRQPLMVVSMLTLALAGTARAAEFDEKLKAPMMRSQVELQTQAQGFTARYRALRDSAPEQLIRDPALARQKFDLQWQIQRAIDARKPLDDLASLGLINQGEGSYSIDLVAYPEWNDLHETMAGMLSRANLDATAPALIARGFRPEDVTTLKEYVASRNPADLAAAEIAPLALGLAKTVRKYDKIRRPVPDATLDTYFYQRTRAVSESDRRWVEGLLKALDPQRGRVLLSTFLEMESKALWAPSDFPAAVESMLAEVRSPDFEARVKAEAKGVAP